MLEKIFAVLILTNTNSQINAMIDIVLPIPRNMNAANKNVKIYRNVSTRNLYL